MLSCPTLVSLIVTFTEIFSSLAILTPTFVEIMSFEITTAIFELAVEFAKWDEIKFQGHLWLDDEFVDKFGNSSMWHQLI